MYFKDINNVNMVYKTGLYLLVLLLVSITATSQEFDDMYFNSRDRVAKKVKKITPAEIILSKYKSGITKANSSEEINSTLLNKYKLKSLNENQVLGYSDNQLKSLKYDRDNLFKSRMINKRFLDVNLNLMFGTIKPNYFHLFDNNMFNSMGLDPHYNMWMPRNLLGVRRIAAYDPMMFFSSPFYSSMYPMMSPSLYNMHYPGLSTYGLCPLSSYYPSWIWSGYNSGGLQNTLSNSHYYVRSEPSIPTVRGPRSGRGVLRSDSNSDSNVDRYFGRRESGITNSNIRKISGNSSTLDDTQNNYMKNHSSRKGSFVTRSSRSSDYQYSGRKSETQNRLRSSRIEAISNSFSGNNSRSSRGLSSMSSVDDMSGRRSAYSASNYFGTSRSSSSGSSRNSIFGSGSNRSGSSFSSSNSSGSNSSGFSSSSRNSGGSSGGGSVVSRGSSGGSSRGKN